MAGLADLLPQVVRQLPEWSGRLNVRRSEWVTVRLWPLVVNPCLAKAKTSRDQVRGSRADNFREILYPIASNEEPPASPELPEGS